MVYMCYFLGSGRKPAGRYSTLLVRGQLPGSSPGGSRVIRRWGDDVSVLAKYIFNYRYIERLEMDSVVGRLVEKRRLNNVE